MEIDREAVMPIFIGESEENLDALEEALLGLEASPGDEDLLGTAFRCAHTLKGNAESLGFPTMAARAHALENDLDEIRSRAAPLSSERVSRMLEASDALRAMLRAVARGGDPESIHAEPKASARGARTLRVGLPTLDRIMTLTGELSIARARLRTLVEQGGRSSVSEMDALLETERLFDELRDQVMKLRLVPLGPMFRAQARVVRDLAASHGKLARLVIEGEDVEVDTKVVEAFCDPLTHMIRNAIDHGIEAPAVRREKGKSSTGTITLRARNEGGRIVIEVRDDGAGFQRDRIVARARENGLLGEERPTDDDIDKLVFRHGFSTAPSVTDLSGRGVGLDVVARNIAALKGTISVESAPGAGAAIIASVPLTLAVVQGFVVAAAGESYVIPIDVVRECVEGPKNASLHEDGSGIINLRGEPLPYLRIRDLFSLSGPPPSGENVVIVEHQGRRAGLAVDTLAGESQSIVKPLDRLFDGLAKVTGTTILGDGRVALILDVPSILEEAVKRKARRPLAHVERS